MAANVDTVFVVTAFGFDLNPRRLERYLTSAWDSGSTPVVVVNKSDIAADPEAELLEVEPVTMGVALHAVSAVTGEGLEALDPYLEPGKTVALLGSSGVGKSTLVNRFAGREVLETAETSAGGRGRHTTSHRELVPLPSGAVLLDTPGMRELQLWADEDVLDTTFSEISDFAAQCRFSDCSHEREPGCAIRRALSDGTLSRERWDSYCKLQRELRALAIRKDGRLRSRGAQGAGEVREKPEEDGLLSRQRGVEVDPNAVRIAEQGVALSPERVPGLLLALEPRFCYTRVDLVDLGGALAFERERDLVAVHALPSRGGS